MARLSLLACLAVLTLAGCGGVGTDRPDDEASLLLDSAPNGVHAGIYLATERDYDEAEGVTLKVRAGTDGLKLLETGRVDMAILDIDELARASNVVGVMAVVQQPLAAVLARRGIARPRDLEGKRVRAGDVAVLRSVVEGDGGDPDKVTITTRGRRVAATTGFWTVAPPRLRQFRVDDFGAPAYPGLVLCVTRQTLDERRPTVQAVIRALQRGYNETQVDPESAVTALVEANPGLDRAAAAAQLDAVSPAFTAGADVYGQLREDALRRWAAWDRRFGIVKKPIDVGAAFDPALSQP